MMISWLAAGGSPDSGQGGSLGEQAWERQRAGETRAGGSREQGVGREERNLKWMNYLLQETIPDSLTLTWSNPDRNPQHRSRVPCVLSDFLYGWVPEAGVIL